MTNKCQAVIRWINGSSFVAYRIDKIFVEEKFNLIPGLRSSIVGEFRVPLHDCRFLRKTEPISTLALPTIFL